MNPGKTRRIVIIDDNAAAIGLVKAAIRLMKTDIEVLAFQNPWKGIDYLKSLRPEDHPLFILLDFDMPGMNGIEVCHELEKIKHLDNVPIHFFSAAPRDEVHPDRLPPRVSKYIQKPFTLDALEGTLTELISESSKT